MRLLAAFLYETILRSDLCDVKLYMADPTAVRLEAFGILFIPLSANVSWMSVYVIIIANLSDLKGFESHSSVLLNHVFSHLVPCLKRCDRRSFRI